MLAKSIVLILAIGVCFGKHHPHRIIRPCAYNDLDCLRVNLAANSKCNVNVRGSIPSEYNIQKHVGEAQYFNSSYIERDLIVRNHDKCAVSEFFFNVEKDTCVMSLDCPSLDLESNRQLLLHHSKKEDSCFNYHIRGLYPLVRLTMTLHEANKMDLCSASVFSDVTAMPIFHVQPQDKVTSNHLSRDLSLMNIFERETFFYRGPHIFYSYINNYICDFGCRTHQI